MTYASLTKVSMLILSTSWPTGSRSKSFTPKVIKAVKSAYNVVMKLYHQSFPFSCYNNSQSTPKADMRTLWQEVVKNPYNSCFTR